MDTSDPRRIMARAGELPTTEAIERRARPHMDAGGTSYIVGTEDFHLLLGSHDLATEGATLYAQQGEQLTRMQAALSLLGEAHDLAMMVTYRATGEARDPARRLERLIMQMSRWRTATLEEMEGGSADGSGPGENRSDSKSDEGQAGVDAGAQVPGEPEAPGAPFQGAARITGLRPATGDEEVELDHELAHHGIPVFPGDVRSERTARSQRAVMRRRGMTVSEGEGEQ